MPKNKKETTSMESNIKSIHLLPEEQPQFIIYTRKIGGVLENVSEHLTYHPDLVRILMLDCVRPYRNNGYLKFIVSDSSSPTVFAMHDLAFGCYTGRIRYETYLDDIQRFLSEKRFYGYVIDHADNNITNHTIYNLSLLSDAANKQKADIVAKVKLPTRLAVAYVDGKYRICMGTEVSDFYYIGKLLSAQGISVAPIEAPVAVLAFVCEDADSLVNCFKYLATNGIEGCVGVKTKQGQWKKDGVCWFQDVCKSIEAQQALAQMEESMFNVFSIKTP